MLKLLTTSGSEPEADILVARLSEAGIRCMRSNDGLGWEEPACARKDWTSSSRRRTS